MTITDTQRAVEQREAPRLTAGDTTGRKRVDGDQDAALCDVGAKHLPEGGARERNRVVGHPLQACVRGDPEPDTLGGRHRVGAVHLRRRRRREARMGARRHVDLDLERVAAHEAAGGIQDRDDGGGIVQRHGGHHLQRQRVPTPRKDRPATARLESQRQPSVAANARGGDHAGIGSKSSRRAHSSTASTPSPVRRFVKTNGRSPRCR